MSEMASGEDTRQGAASFQTIAAERAGLRGAATRDLRPRATTRRPRAERMSAAVLEGPGRVTLVDLPRPLPRPREALVRLQGCGVCGSNLGPWAGLPWTVYPLEPGAPGHEAWGEVESVGEEVTEISPGQRVAFLSTHAFASHDVAPMEHVVALPPALDDQPFPGEPLGCAMNVFRRSAVRPGQTVAIVGVGFLGALLTRLAAAAGARVVALSRRRFSLQVAGAMGAEEALLLTPSTAGDPAARQVVVERVRELTRGELCDCVIEAVGKQETLDVAAELTRERGRLVIAGYHQDGPRQVNMQLWNWRGLDVVNAHERDPALYVQGMRDAVVAVSSGLLDPASLYTHRYPLERLDEALDHTRDRPPGFMKALVSFGGDLS